MGRIDDISLSPQQQQRRFDVRYVAVVNVGVAVYRVSLFVCLMFRYPSSMLFHGLSGRCGKEDRKSLHFSIFQFDGDVKSRGGAL